MKRTPSPHCGILCLFPQFGLERALIPGQLDLRHFAARPIVEGRRHAGRRDFRMRRRAARLDYLRGIELQGPERQVDPVGAEVGHGAAAEVPPAIPFRTRHVHAVEGPARRRSEPQLPVQSTRHRHLLFRPFGGPHDVAVLLRFFLALPTPGARYPHMSLAHRPDGAALNQFDDAAIIGAGVDLRAHLRGDVRFLRRLR